MRAALREAGISSSTKYALFTDWGQWEVMNNPALCKEMYEQCRDYQAAGPDVFDHIFFYSDFPVPPVIARREKFQAWPELWLKRIIATLHSPFETTMCADSDVYACSNYEALFDYVSGDVDVAMTLAPAPFGCSRNFKGAFRDGFPPEYEEFYERNLGLHIVHTGRASVIQLIALFRDIYIRQVNDTVNVSIGNDQSAWREAIFTLKDQIKERIIPSNVGCRHDLGCPDGCMVVHRHHMPELSGKDYEAWKASQRLLQKEKVANAAKAWAQ